MGNCRSGCSHEFKDLRCRDAYCTMGESSKKSHCASATPANATSSTSSISGVDERIERSKSHWSMLADHSGDKDEEEVGFEASNVQEFLALQSDPTYGRFFGNFNGDCVSTGVHNVASGELAVGRKFAEGGQAELFEAQIKWYDPQDVEDDRIYGREYVVKVFKKGTLLKNVKSQLPQGLLVHHIKSTEYWKSSTAKARAQFTSHIYWGILLKGGRFAFLVRKHDFDLRTLIEDNMTLKNGKDCGPFSKGESECIMYQVVMGLDWLHNRDIVHRDLKASNVLVREYKSGCQRWYSYVADYECSIGVIGTDFFRAPEILKACTEQKVKERPQVFSRASDVYSYGMICYEILTGKLPFEDHPLRGRPSLLIDLVVKEGLRPEVPKYVADWTCKLLDGCWQYDPTKRHGIEEIMKILLSNSTMVCILEDEMKKVFGENYRW